MFLTINSNFKWILIIWALALPSNYTLRESTPLTHHHVVVPTCRRCYSRRDLTRSHTQKIVEPSIEYSLHWCSLIVYSYLLQHHLCFISCTGPLQLYNYFLIIFIIVSIQQGGLYFLCYFFVFNMLHTIPID